jgi:hypothetical protein
MATKFIHIILICLGLALINQNKLYSQIDDIKTRSDDNKDNHNNSSSNNNNNDSDDSGGDIAESCASGCSSGCMDVGCNIFAGFLGEYTENVASYRDTNPTILSFEANAGFSGAMHITSAETYNYLIYMPTIRGNLAAFLLEFRFNLLTEFSNDLPNSFRCWDFIAGFNIVPSDKFILTIGTGVEREMYNDMYFHEYYIGSRIWSPELSNYLELDYRISADYETGVLPFQEAGVRYNFRIMNFGHVFAYVNLGLIYQNYYQAHDIWGLRAGIAFNIH